MRIIQSAAALIVGIVLSCSTPADRDVTCYVDPFIGTAAHGHVFPGATTPFGMVQISPDNGTSGWDWCSGYNYSDSVIAGFSHSSKRNRHWLSLRYTLPSVNE